jgi:hypothetical protein
VIFDFFSDLIFHSLPSKVQWALIGLAVTLIAVLAALYFTGNL